MWTWNVAHSHWHKSIDRQRATSWTAGVGPFSIACTRATRCALFSSHGRPGGLRSMKPAGLCVLNFTTQSRTILPKRDTFAAGTVTLPMDYASDLLDHS